MKAKVFISWSGERSKVFADILRRWLPKVVHVSPFFSQSDIRKGSNWYNDIIDELKQTKVGVFCITCDNDQAPWLIFEAGAISVGLARPKVCPLLFGISPASLKGPLLTFQAAEFSKNEMLKVVEMLNEEH